MISQAISFINKNKLFDTDSKLLVTVSGGIDSIVLLDILVNAGYKVSVAHCNFQLRGSESDGDETFVRKVVEKYQIPIFVKKFDTKSFADTHKLSIQMAARQLRYQWFESVRKQNQFDYVVVAHNSNDVAETFFINLLRGTGIRGLASIPVKNEFVVRPLLFASRTSIVEFAKSKHLDFREDSSNQQTKYTRNKIRHDLLPLLNDINPNSIENILHTVQLMGDTALLYTERIEEYRSKLFRTGESESIIDLEELLKTQAPASILFELIHEFGYSGKQCFDIVDQLHGTSGQIFYSHTHRMLHDRSQLIIAEVEEPNSERYYIESIVQIPDLPINLKFELHPTVNYSIPKSSNIASIDFEMLEFPLMIRKWHKGDYFQPLGMSGFKKLSDFFIDIKCSILDKEKTWIIETGGKIVWIVGYRIDNRFKITENTRKVLSISI